MSGRSRRTHYSYSTYADPKMARNFDQRRFSGPIGELLAATQAKVLANFVGRIQGRRILDVGTGTGRAALMLANGGALVTGIDASEQMLAVARKKAAEQGVTVTFRRGDAHKLDYADRAFDISVSLRVLMHAPRWRTCVAELCRVSDQLVILDYPSSRSVAAIESMGRRFIHRLGVRTEPYRVFSHQEISDALTREGFRIRSVHRQFVLPIAFHKMLGSRRMTESVEDLFDRAGLLGFFGSPVTLVAERCKIS